MENKHPIENLMTSTMENLNSMVDVNTVIGNPIETKDGTIIPISTVSFGFASGGSEFGTATVVSEKEHRYPFGGGSGAGATVKPVAFLVVKENSIRLLPVDADNTYDRIVDAVPQVLDVIKDFFNKKESKNNSFTANSKENNTMNTDELEENSKATNEVTINIED